jgi:nucleotide-binding universal stress UspA family protein
MKIGMGYRYEMYKTILVPLDGSKMADKAFTHALSIAKTFDAELLLLTVIPENVVPTGAYRTWVHPSMVRRNINEIITLARQEATDFLNEKMKECEKNNVKASYKILEGDSASQIIKAAEQKKVDLIVMGSVGLTGIKKLKTLGSVSRKVSENVSCPTLIVR